jgi:hypothetical protein
MSNCVVQHVPANQNNCGKTLKYQNMYVQEYPLTHPVALNFVYYTLQLKKEPKHTASLRALYFCKWYIYNITLCMLRIRCLKLHPTIRYAWFQKTWNIRKPGAKLCVVLFIEFLPYIGFWNENPLYENVQHTHEQRKYAFVIDSRLNWIVWLICCNALCMMVRLVVCKSCSCCWNLTCRISNF